jgi:hypothetical protein
MHILVVLSVKIPDSNKFRDSRYKVCYVIVTPGGAAHVRVVTVYKGY